ncbi:MAG: transcriptional repressor [Lachnospira sp.]|nr:transcriptional repressor [Lachnospira sp.]
MKEYKTKARDCILDYFKNHCDERVTAAEVYQFLKDNGNNVNLATIYRNLDKMSEKGELLKSKNVSDGCAFYSYTEKGDSCCKHLHLQCKICGHVIHLEEDLMNVLYSYVSDKMGFSLDCKESVLMGVCSNCRLEAEKEGVYACHNEQEHKAGICTCDHHVHASHS